MTLAILDVHYPTRGAVAACVLAEQWKSTSSLLEFTVALDDVAEYVPGAFYRRELPCLLAVLKELDSAPTVVVVDGYVWLGNESEPGLGAHLHRELGGAIAVVGVAKTRYAGATSALEVHRGGSRRPLLVSAIGMSPTDAAREVANMDGPHRIPTLLRRVDQLCRGLSGVARAEALQ